MSTKRLYKTLEDSNVDKTGGGGKANWLSGGVQQLFGKFGKRTVEVDQSSRPSHPDSTARGEIMETTVLDREIFWPESPCPGVKNKNTDLQDNGPAVIEVEQIEVEQHYAPEIHQSVNSLKMEEEDVSPDPTTEKGEGVSVSPEPEVKEEDEFEEVPLKDDTEASKSAENFEGKETGFWGELTERISKAWKRIIRFFGG